MADDQGMTDEELEALLDSARGRMLNSEGGELSEIRQDNLDRYLGEPDGRERPGESAYVTREVFEAVEWLMPELLRIFTAGDKAVSFEPVGPEDEAQAAQETDIVNHYLLQENNGFLTFHDWFKDALINPNGYAKVWTEMVETTTTEEYQGLTQAQLVEVYNAPNNEIVAHESIVIPVQGPQGVVQEEAHNIQVRVTTKEPTLRFDSVRPEEVLIDSECPSICVDDARYVCHRTQRTRSWLIEAGYDPDLLDTASTEDGDDYQQEDVNRKYNSDEYPEDQFLDEASQLYWLEEWYVLVDFDGDGIAERRKVDIIGGVLFENIEYDYQPLIAITANRIPHKHSGLSVADAVSPIQELSTYFQREINNNLARVSRPRKYVNESAMTTDGQTLEQLLDVDSEVIVTRDVMGIVPEQHQSVIMDLMGAQDKISDQTQMRTGISPNLSLDPSVLQQSTAGAFAGAMQSASQRVELIARCFAETGVRDAMRKAHRQIKTYQNKPKTMKIRGEWIETNPQDWRDRTNVTVNVGLGFSDKATQLQADMNLLQLQQQMIGFNMVTEKHLFQTLEDIIESMGKKGVDRYFQVPEQQPQQEQQPDPITQAQVGLMQQQGQALQMDQQRKDQETQSKMQRENDLHMSKKEQEEAKTQQALANAAKAATEAGSAQMAQTAEVLSTQFGAN